MQGELGELSVISEQLSVIRRWERWGCRDVPVERLGAGGDEGAMGTSIVGAGFTVNV